MSKRKHYNQTDYKKLVEKGIRQLYAYLNDINNDSETLSDEIKKKLFKVIGESFREKMANDDAFFDIVENFLIQRSTKKKKEDFYFDIMKILCRKNSIKKKYAKKYPNEPYLQNMDEKERLEWFD